MNKRTKNIAGVGTDRHKQAVKNIAAFDKAFPPSESQIVCASVLFTEAKLQDGSVTIEDLFNLFHRDVFG
jgi:hypothetical protein